MVRKSKEAGAAVEEHPGGGHIVVTAQQSRYALDAVDAPASKEVKQTNIPALRMELTIQDSNQRSVNLSLKSRTVEPHNTTPRGVEALCSGWSEWHWKINTVQSDR